MAVKKPFVPLDMTELRFIVISSGAKGFIGLDPESARNDRHLFSGSITTTGASGAFFAMEAMPFLALALAL